MDWKYSTIWFDQIEKDKFLDMDADEKSIEAANLTAIEYALLWHYKSKAKNFEKLPDSETLQYLELNWGNAVNCIGLGKFTNLKRLELHYCTKLETDLGLASLANSLEHLHIDQSKKFTFSDELEKLKNLKVLVLVNCAPIQDLKFLNKFPNLIEFRFAFTNVLDGDLSPILNHPTLKVTAFENKRHYSHTYDAVAKALLLKAPEAFREYVHKGEFRTYKYSVAARQI